MFANCAIALGGSSWLGGGKYWQFVQGIVGGSSHFVRGDGNLVQLFLSVSNFSIHGGRVRNWSILVEQG